MAKSEAAWREALAKSETGWREALAQFEAGTHASLAALAKADADLRESITHTHTLIAELETRLIKWFVATAVTLAGLSGSLAFLAAKFIH
ncbi:hypothetical protein E4L98_10005 [Duganella callida]|uniref:DUF1640 domain-containing protein n=1 Tax=Duganella callida TaxID=2561932 RepID=A0A4Y9SHZ6_9BURK|nr:hypothetical protein E4L98_10005 [Duganella callida]